MEENKYARLYQKCTCKCTDCKKYTTSITNLNTRVKEGKLLKGTSSTKNLCFP